MTPDLITRAREAMDLEPRASRRALWREVIEALERAAPLRIKPLKWVSYVTDKGTTVFMARTSIGDYLIVSSGWFLRGQSSWNQTQSADAAKAAAQADYEARIRSALDPDPTDWQARAERAEAAIAAFVAKHDSGTHTAGDMQPLRQIANRMKDRTHD
jgi:hypothetical protein